MDFLLRSLAVIVKEGLSAGGLVNLEDVEGIVVNPGGNLTSVPVMKMEKFSNSF